MYYISLIFEKVFKFIKKSLLLCFILYSISSFGQKKERVYYGIGALYNFQTQGVAYDLRVRIPLYRNIYVSPRFSYFPASNTIHEYYAGLDAGYQFMRKYRIRPYIYAAGYYDNWINSFEFPYNKKAQKNNIVAEAGAGLIFAWKCLHPYIEYRYDTKWLEGSLGIGILFNWTCCFNSKKSAEKDCPKFKN
jgi:hypothetical protein